jgi:energy-coupling factor transport system substrate-specific component
MIALLVITAVGVALFAWPLTGLALPAAALMAVAVLAGTMALAAIEAGTRRLDSRRLALLAAIAAIDAALRAVVVTGLLGWSPIFFLVLCAGYVYGPRFGFLAGSLALLASALVTGGVGPWLPYEMLGTGWVGMLAGAAGLGRSVPPRRRDLIVLAIIGSITGWLYGGMLDLWDWSTFYRAAPDFGWSPGLPPPDLLARFGRFYVSTSLVWDTARAAGNALAVALLGRPVLAALERLRLRTGFAVVDEAAALGEPSAGAPRPARPALAAADRPRAAADGALAQEVVDLVGEPSRREAQLEQGARLDET